MDLNTLNVSSLCRVCMEKGAENSLFTSCSIQALADKAMACANVKMVSTDDLPSSICDSCVNKLDIAYDFKTVCEATDFKLRHLIAITKPEKNEDDSRDQVFTALEVVVKEECEDILEPKEEADESWHIEDDSTLDSDTALISAQRTKKAKKTPVREKRKRGRPRKEPLGENSPKKKATELEGKLLKEKRKRSLEDSMRGPMECGECGRVCPTPSHYRAHRRTHSGERPFRCADCPAAFALRNTLVVHRRLHTGERPFTCHECGKGFAHKSHLTTHSRSHTGLKPYPCPHCPRSFSQRHSAVNHARLHTGEKPFVCNYCGKAFSWKKYLTDHLRTHTGEQPYKCTVCGKAFSNSANIRVHMRIHTGEKPYECNICQKKFSQMDNMINHRNGHDGLRPYKCTSCDKTFIRTSHLARHKKSHQPQHVEQQQCDVCSKWVLNIKKHLIIHQPEKKFPCDICGKDFRWSHGLGRHLRRIHSIHRQAVTAPLRLHNTVRDGDPRPADLGT